jgi:hypothetical protein
MILDGTELKIKEDINTFFSGGYDNSLTLEQLDMVKRFSFLFNHISYKNYIVTFEYGDYKIPCDLRFLTNCGVNVPDVTILETHGWYEELKNYITYSIRHMEGFESAYKQFTRDFKIKSLFQ